MVNVRALLQGNLEEDSIFVSSILPHNGSWTRSAIRGKHVEAMVRIEWGVRADNQ